MSEALPNGWTTAPLSSLLIALESGSRPSGGVRGIAEGVPSIGGEHLNYDGTFNFTRVKYVPEEFAAGMNRGHIQTGDVLVVKDGATTGKTAFVDRDFPFPHAVVNEHVFICRSAPEIEPRFLFRFLTSEEGQERILANFKGSAQGGINQSFAAKTEIPVAPLAEQQRIVAKLEELLSRVDECDQRFARIAVLLKRFRQSVLAAACSGRLTVDWRERYPSAEEWKSLELVQLAERIQIGPFGTQLHKADYVSTGIPLINPTHIQGSQIVHDPQLTVSETKYEELENYALREDDIILARRGEMGRCALVSSKESGWLCGTGSLFIRPKSCVHPGFLFLILRSAETKTFLESESKGTTMSNLNLQILDRVPVPTPPFAEQREIARRVQELLALTDPIEGRVTQVRAHVSRLSPALLTKAFRGDLVSTEVEVAREEGRN